MLCVLKCYSIVHQNVFYSSPKTHSYDFTLSLDKNITGHQLLIFYCCYISSLSPAPSAIRFGVLLRHFLQREEGGGGEGHTISLLVSSLLPKLYGVNLSLLRKTEVGLM